MNKKRILKGNIYHHNAINEITLAFTNTYNIPVYEAVLLAQEIHPAIMDYDDDGNLFMSTQLFQHIKGMSIGYKRGYSSGVEETTKEIHKLLDSLGL